MAVSSTTRRTSNRAALAVRLQELALLRVSAGVQGEEAMKLHAGSSKTNGELAIIHEYGVEGIPAHPSHRVAVAVVRPKIQIAKAKIVNRAIKGGGSILTLGRLLGETMAQEMRHQLVMVRKPVLKPATVARRRRAGDPDPTNPLYFTHELHDAITGKATL